MGGNLHPDPATLLADCEPEPGQSEFHTMPDGWRLHSETWTPDGSPTHMMLHLHGWFESTMTVGVRRVAKMCKSRNILLVAYEMHGHGLSLEKGGKKREERTRGQIEDVDTVTNHNVEMAKIMIAKHKLPLIIMGHSQGANGVILSTRRVVETCQAAGVPFVTGVYLSPVMSITPPCCCFLWQLQCCCALLPCACCGYCYVPMDGKNTLGLNPGGIVCRDGESDRNQTHVNPYNYFTTCLGPPSGGGAPDLAKLLPEIDIGVPGKIFAATKENEAKVFLTEKMQQALPSTLSVEALDGMTHDYLSADPQSMEAIGKIFAYIDEARGLNGPLGSGAVTTSQPVAPAMH